MIILAATYSFIIRWDVSDIRGQRSYRIDGENVAVINNSERELTNEDIICVSKIYFQHKT